MGPSRVAAHMPALHTATSIIVGVLESQYSLALIAASVTVLRPEVYDILGAFFFPLNVYLYNFVIMYMDVYLWVGDCRA